MTHSVMGYALIQFALLAAHLSYRSVLLVAVATAMHVTPELSGMQLGRLLRHGGRRPARG